jgi:hypothetical protein
MSQNTNLNTSPYFDDFAPEKNYKRVLFKPGTPLQARELTTLQTILQDQIEKFGKSFFREGSIVIPGNIAYDPEYSCVQIDTSHLGIFVENYIENLVGIQIKGQLSGVTAKIDNYLRPSESETNNYTLYIKYISSSDNDFTQKTFVDGENLITLENIQYSATSLIRENSTFANTIISNSVFTGSAVKIESGVYFIRGFFVEVLPQTVILDQYSNLPSYRVGLSIEESTIAASQTNLDLFDNARGFSNFSAPGADRLKIDAILVKKSITDFNDENFIELLRVEDGSLKNFTNSKKETSNLIKDELARRTFDESGDYYVIPFRVQVKESLNDGRGNNGVYNEKRLTSQGNVPSDNLLSVQISPGKAYVKGFEVETINTVNIDLEKSRTSNKIFDTSLPFSLGSRIVLNNVYGSVPIGTGTTVKLYNSRTITPGNSSGLEIGLARVYDFKLNSASYTNASTPFDISLFDIQTYTYLTLNSTATISTPALIEGKNSGAYGFLLNSVTFQDQIVLYEVSGEFQNNEAIKVNGEDFVRSIIRVANYGLTDVSQITATNPSTFTADTKLDQKIKLASDGASFTINPNGTVINSSATFVVGIKTGDIVSYTKPGDSLPTFNKVVEVSQTLKTLVIDTTPDVIGINTGSLPDSSITTTDFVKVSPKILDNNNSSFYVPLENEYVESIDLSNSRIVIRKSYSVTVSSNALTSQLETDSSYSLEPFDEENYTLTYDDGKVENLNREQFSISGARTINLINLSQNGPATLVATLSKRSLKSRKKQFRRATVLDVRYSASTSSGTGTGTINDGLTYSQIYGIRIQDEEICLNVPDVQNILGIFESSNENDASLPQIVLNNLNSSILNTVPGELIYGQRSGAVATVVKNNITDTVDFIYYNEKSFIVGERVTFKESKVSGTVGSVIEGDRNIISNFNFYSGQYSQIADYSFIRRKLDVNPPSKRLKIVYQNYVIDFNDDGDFVTVNSFSKDRYSKDLQLIQDKTSADIIDFRPRVVAFDPNTSTRSPFEHFGRKYDSKTNNSPFTIAQDSQIILSYSHYFGRIDRLYVNKNGEFFVSKGIPTLNPSPSDDIGNSLEIATLFLPPYVFSADNVQIKLSENKRYRMRDIARLEDRLNDVAKYTSLSLLESDTKNLSLRDPDTGLNKFKCGFFVDNFRSPFGGSIKNKDFKCSIDSKNGLLRPQHYTTSIDLLLGSEVVSGTSNIDNPDADFRFVKELGDPNIVKVGDVVCLKYKDKKFVENTFATRVENVNPFNVVNWIGSIQLNPASDNWVDTKIVKKVEDLEGNYTTTISNLNIDANTGLSPIEWGAWETTWTGSSVSTLFYDRTVSRSASEQLTRGSFVRGLGIPITITTSENSSITTRLRELTTDTSNQTRNGIQFRVTERTDLVNLGPQLVSTDIIYTMRSRNVEFVARRMKPRSRLYAFFDNIDVDLYIIPKLLEISMISGTFVEGETVVGNAGSASISFRLANSNHRFGPYNEPTSIYAENPYNPLQVIPTNYSSTSPVLNVDTASLELQSASSYYGYVVPGMQLKGLSSGAIASVSDIRLITDGTGTVIGSFYIPDPNLASTPKFNTGAKTFLLTSSATNSSISGAVNSNAETIFNSAGALDTFDDVTLRIRNADIERSVRTGERVVTTSSSRIIANTTFSSRTITQTRWVDPLAQSFEVVDDPGIYVTKCDIFFFSKDEKGLPVTMQIRTMQNGFPTTTILPFGEVILDANDIKVSEDASVPTTFTFPSPVYLEGENTYSVVLLSASDEYLVFISRMGETDIRSATSGDTEKITVSQQPLLGSLFKSQNGATWDASQLEDLKFALYRAEFTSQSGSVRFYNPELNVGNKQISALRNNPLDAYSRKLLVGVGKSFTSTEVSALTSGTKILQLNNPFFSGFVGGLSGAIGIGSTLSITSSGIAFTSGFQTYSDVDLISLNGRGFGGKINLSVESGVAIAATVSVGGTGYVYGESLSVDYTKTDGLGRNLILSIPNIVGVISQFNAIYLNSVQGKLNENSTDHLYYVGSGGTASLGNASIRSINIVEDGLHFKISQNNHGMYSQNDLVQIYGIESDIKPETLNISINSTYTGNVAVSNIGIFTSFEGQPVSIANTGYVKVGEEIIGYNDVNVSTNELITIVRGIDGTISGSYSENLLIFKYELGGISLRRINTSHQLNQTDYSKYSIDLDNYHVKVDMTKNGVNRSSSNVAVPELFFNIDKSCGSYEGIPVTGLGPRATQNIPFNIVRPNITTLTPEGTNINAKLRTTSGTIPNSNLTAFIDQGFQNINLRSNNEFFSPRIICSRINEVNKLTDLPGNKSLTLECNFITQNDKVTPMIDLDRVSLITVANRINSPISNYITDPRINYPIGDPVAGIYVSKLVRLQRSADSLKVLFDAYRPNTSDIRVLYRIIRPDGSNENTTLWQLFPGYENLDINREVIEFSKNNGKPDTLVNESITSDDFRSYEFTATRLPQFVGYQIKIHMTGRNSSLVPRIRDLRIIAAI